VHRRWLASPAAAMVEMIAGALAVRRRRLRLLAQTASWVPVELWWLLIPLRAWLAQASPGVALRASPRAVVMCSAAEMLVKSAAAHGFHQTTTAERIEVAVVEAARRMASNREHRQAVMSGRKR